MNTMQYTVSKDIPVVADADVVVIGGGPGGIGAAVAAARRGARTVLLERYGTLGGMAVSGEVHPFMPNHAAGRCLDRPVYPEWVRRMWQYLPAHDREAFSLSPEVNDGPSRMISTEAAMLAAEDLVREAGATLLYHHTLADVIAEDGHLRAAVMLSKSGFVAVTGKVFIDSTGDGDLATLAGCEFEQGGPSGHSQPMTACFKLSGVDRDRTPSPSEITRRFREARDRGEVTLNPREDVLQFAWFRPDVVHFNTTRIIHRSATHGEELSDAELQGHDQVREMVNFLRTHVEGYENGRIHSVARHIGVRESRRILGEAYLTLEDFKAARKFDDAIARCRYNVDIHNPDGEGTEFVRLPENDYYEVPFGCIVPRGSANLLMACRAISVDHAVHASVRVMPPVISLGQAAGLAAAMATSRGVAPRELDGKEVRSELVTFGAYLD